MKRGRAALLVSAWVALSPSLGVTRTSAAPDERYRACPGHELLQHAAGVTWRAGRSLIEAHRRLRATLHAALPEGESRILWYANGGDLATTTFSVVAVRRADGRWHVDGVGQNQIWLPNVPPTLFSPLGRDLSAEESARLDALLEDPCLYGGPTDLADLSFVGGLSATLEIETPHHRWIGGWLASPTPQERAITDLLGAQ
jgi:hypothetical protein